MALGDHLGPNQHGPLGVSELRQHLPAPSGLSCRIRIEAENRQLGQRRRELTLDVLRAGSQTRELG